MIIFSISQQRVDMLRAWWERQRLERWVVIAASLAAIAATAYSYHHGWIVAYGDSESHLDIAKRVVDSLTPGFAQLGGIWLPLPHVLMLPFVYSNFLWRTGLAGSIVSGICFVAASLYIYKLVWLLTENRAASLIGALVFILNPNILYLQSTPLTEIPLIVFFVLSSYYFIAFLKDQSRLSALLAAAFFGFCATLSRYDGWSLVLMEAGILLLLYLPWKKIPRSLRDLKAQWDASRYKKMEGMLIIFCTLAFFGIVLWLGWDWLILGDPLYFTNSVYSAKSQQQAWLARGMLPGRHNAWMSFLYYAVDSMSNVGVFIFLAGVAGLAFLLFRRDVPKKWFIALVLLVPFFFNVATLYMGQSVIFIPHISPVSYEWRLFNARYGVMMAPAAAVLVAYLFYRLKNSGRLVLSGFVALQVALYIVGYSPVISLQDGTVGLSSAITKSPDAQNWLNQHYDGGLVLADDFARSISVIRSTIPMKNMIYVGNKPYWDDSFKAPEKYATWIIMQQNDDVWNHLYEDPAMLGRVYKYFTKQYTSPEIVIFRRNPDVPVDPADALAANK